MKQKVRQGGYILACALLALVGVSPARANPEGGTVSAGSASITATGSKLDIHQTSARAVIDWRGFDIANGEHTEFHQPDSNAIALNRVNSTRASQIDGRLTANGNVVIINQNGVVFGRGATVDANSVVATTANASNEKFMAGGKVTLDQPGNPDAAIINEGTITAKEAGLVGLVAPTVENHGVINAKLGRAQLASGDTATVDFYGDGLLEVAVSDEVTHQLVNNTGTINADGGHVALTAAAGQAIVDKAINVGGSISTQTVEHQQGAIIIASAGTTGDVIVTAKLDASGKAANTKGGAVHITGKQIALKNGSGIDVSGKSGGGEILLGGDYKGDTYRGAMATPASGFDWGNTAGGYSAINQTAISNFLSNYYKTLNGDANVPTADRLFVDYDVTLDASANNGNGGRIINWSEKGTVFAGHADVSTTGNNTHGGFIEISGKNWLNFAGTINADATNGESGMLLLDPADITISNAANSAISGATPFQSTGAASSNLNVGTLQTALGAANVTITSAAGTGGNGDITFLDPVAWNSTRSLTVTASRNIAVNNTITNAGTGSITLNANVAATGDIAINNNITTGGSITALARRDLTVAPGATLTTGAAGALSLRAANAVTTGTGNLTLGGTLASGSGALTLLSGINGTRPSYTMTTTNFTPVGASVGAVTITGFNDVTIDRNLTSSGAIVITAMRDLTLNAARTITTGAAAALTLQAANNVVTGTGNLTLDGILAPGTGTLTLRSGINGTRPSYTMTAANFTPLGATVGVVSITGFQDMVIDRNLTSSGNITLTAMRDLTINAARTITTGAAGALSLNAANASTAGTGNLTLDGILAPGTGAFTLVSGVNGTRPNYTMTAANFTPVGATVGAVSITGFNDVTIDRNLTSSGAIIITAMRDLTINAARTITTGAAAALTLQAANNVVTGTGNLTLDGILAPGSGALTLRSGINGTRPSYTMTAANFTPVGATVGVVSITGFLDLIIDRNLTSSGNITLTAMRDLTVNAARTITTGAAGAVSLNAANGVVGGTGNLTISGNLATGTGNLTLLSGINGTRPSYTMSAANFSQLGATVGTVSITGFLDLIIDRNLTSSAAVTMLAYRDLTLNAARTITTGAASAIDLRAANGAIAGTGNLTLSGNLSTGTGNVTLRSGANVTRPSWTMDGTSFVTQGATVGAVDIQGFQDITLDRNLTSSGAVTILANRDLTLATGRTLTNGAASAMSLQAANAVVAGTGNLNLNGNLSVGTGAFTLLSGINGTRPAWTANATTLVRQGATFGTVNWQGFGSLTIDRPLNTSGSFTFSNNTQTVLSDNLTSTGTMTFGNAVSIDEGTSVTLASTNSNIAFSSTVNGTAGGAAENLTITAGTGTVTFTGITGGTTPLGNLSVTSDNITVSAAMNGTGTITLAPTTAGRAVNIGTAAGDTSTAAGFNLSNNETGRIANGWASIILGSLTSGDTTNSRASWVDAVTFLSGNDFINAAATSGNDTILVRAVRDVIVNQNMVTSNTSANALTLVAGRNFLNNKGAGSLTTGAGGRWLVYSTNPTGTTGEQLLVNAFNRYTCSYGGACPALGSGNGFLYSYTPLMDVTISGQTYAYGDALIAPTGYTLVPTYLNALDTAQGIIGGSGIFQTDYVQGNNAGTSYSITDNGSTFTSNLGYGFNFIAPTGTVAQRTITVRATDQSHTYGFGGLGTSGYSITSGTLYGTDAISGVTLATNATISGAGEYSYSATPWTLTPSAAVFSSGLGSNYAVTYTNAPTGLTIAQRALAVSATGIDKAYDGLTSATVTLADNRLSGDVLNANYTSANFVSATPGIGKTVNVSGITLTGADSANYLANSTATTTATIDTAGYTPPVNATSLPDSVRKTSQGMIAFDPHYLLSFIGSVSDGRLIPKIRALFFMPLSKMFNYNEREDNNYALPYLEEADI